MDAEFIARGALYLVGAEKEFFEDAEREFIQSNQVVENEYQEMLDTWYREYPQYNPKNKGKGYRQYSTV